MALPTTIPTLPLRQQMLDKNGLLTRPWISFLQSLQSQTLTPVSNIVSFHGTPVGIVNAPAGTLGINLDGGTGSTLWANETGGVGGWVPVVDGGGGGLGLLYGNQ